MHLVLLSHPLNIPESIKECLYRKTSSMNAQTMVWIRWEADS